MMNFHKFTLCTFAVTILVQSCAKVGKDTPFTEFKKEISALKTDTATAMDLTKLDYATQLKMETIAAADLTAGKTAAANQAAIDLAQALDQFAKATKALDEALANPKTDEATKTKLAHAMQEAEVAIPNAKKKVESAHKQASAAGERLKERIDAFDIRVAGGDPLDWGTKKMPNYFELIRMRDTAIRCVEVVEEYSNLLGLLASPDLIDEARFQKAADQLNASAAQVFTKSNGSTALISTAAIYSARIYLQKRQAKDLQKAISENQPNIEKFVKLMEDGIILFVRNADNYYSRELRISEKIYVPGDDAKAGRAAAAGSLVSTNQQYIALLDSLRKLRERYRKLPESHLALSRTVVSPSASVAYIEHATGVAADIGSQYERSAAQNKYQDALLASKASDEVAIGFERRATTAEAETNLAKSKHDIAQAITESNPTDQAANDELLRLKKEYLELKVKSDELRAKATYFRSLANIEKGDADRLKPPADPAKKSE